MPEPGDVIVFITPENEEEDYIKRVVAVGGQRVAVDRGRVIVDGQPLIDRSAPDVERYGDLSVPLRLDHGGGQPRAATSGSLPCSTRC